MAERILVWEQNPDPLFSECRVSGLNERGVEFTTIEQMAGSVTFIGESALIEALGKLYGLTVNEVLRCFDDGNQAQQKKLQRERDRAEAAAAKFASLRDAVLALPDLEVAEYEDSE